MTQRIEYNEEMVGNGHPTKTDTLNRLVNLITAAGGILFGTGIATAEYRILPKFSAHKNTSNQTGLVTGNFTKITFTTEEYDIGSAYDAANSKWIPGIVGKAHIDAGILWTVGVDQKTIRIDVYKNGVSYKSKSIQCSGTDIHSISISCNVLVDAITDYFDIYGYHETGGDRTISGAIPNSWFMGHFLP